MTLHVDVLLIGVLVAIASSFYILGRVTGKRAALVEIYNQNQAVNEMEMMTAYVNSLKGTKE